MHRSLRNPIFIQSSLVSLCMTIGAARRVQCTSAKVQPISLTNKVVLITGASSGIGKATAWRFAEEGSKLILVARREDKLKELKTEITRHYPSAAIHVVAMSVTDIEKVANLPNNLPQEFQEVDILVNNAGLALGATSVEQNVIADAVTTLDTNVLGTIAFSRAFLPGMKSRSHGHLINVGSCAGHFTYATGSVYNASKFAVHGFTSAARHDLVGTPIRVTHISPGIVSNTEFSNVRFGDDKKAQAVYENIESLSPEDVSVSKLF